MKTVSLSWNDVEKNVATIIQQMQNDKWLPDYVVGITRGGLVPATMISNFLCLSMHTLKVSLRDDEDTESNLWMAEHAFGYIEQILTPSAGECMGPWHNPDLQKKILIVDDINDSGATINWIMDDWKSGCMPGDTAWNKVWDNNVRMAVLYDNTSSEAKMKMRYSANVVNRLTDPQWIVFPWEVIKGVEEHV